MGEQRRKEKKYELFALFVLIPFVDLNSQNYYYNYKYSYYHDDEEVEPKTEDRRQKTEGSSHYSAD